MQKRGRLGVERRKIAGTERRRRRMDAANCKMWELSVGRNLEVVPRVFPQQMGAWLAVQSHGQVGGGVTLKRFSHTDQLLAAFPPP